MAEEVNTETPSSSVDEQDVLLMCTLMDEINTSVGNVEKIVDILQRQVENGELNVGQGLSYLEMKNNMLLSYLSDLTYFVSLKCSGKRIENDPCIDRLIEIRTILEKIRPIDQKLKFQIERLIKSSGTTMEASQTFRPNLGNLENAEDNEDSEDGSDDDDDDDDDDDEDSAPKSKSGVYVPPKLSAVHYPGDENAFQRNKRLQEKSKKQAVSSAILQDLAEEYLDTPIEVHQSSRAQQKLTKQQKEKQEYEEEYLTRLPVTKAEKHENRRLTTLGVLGTEITDYKDTKSQGKKRKGKQTPKSKGKGFKRKKFSH